MKLYWVGTRLYDPETGRFINADSIEYLDPKTINGCNLYAYCLNNPVMNIDPNGKVVITLGTIIASIIVGGLIGGGFGALSAAINGGNVWAGFGIGFVSGAISGVLGLFQLPAYWSIGISLLIGAGSEVANILFNKGEIEVSDIPGIVKSAIFSLVGGMFASGVGRIAGNLDNFCHVGFSAVLDSITNSLGLGIDAIIDSWVDGGL